MLSSYCEAILVPLDRFWPPLATPIPLRHEPLSKAMYKIIQPSSDGSLTPVSLLERAPWFEVDTLLVDIVKRP
jgi:hypothetical protein